MKKMKQILVPFAVVAVGVLGAFATQMSTSNDIALQTMKPGWIDSPNGCNKTEIMCFNTGPEICTVLVDGVVHQLKGKVNETDKTCPLPLFKF